LKDPKSKDPNILLEKLRTIENAAGLPAFLEEGREDIQVQIRVDEKIGPAMFKADPLIPGGYVANSLTIRAMRPDIFVLGGPRVDIEDQRECDCGKTFDLQFWKICPYCGREPRG